MKLLLKTVFVLASVFMSTFLILSILGVLSKEDIEVMLHQTKDISSLALGIAVAGFLYADLFIAVPTLTISLLAGFFLGFAHGFVAVTSGFLLAGYTGYFISARFGEQLLHRISTKDNVLEMQELFKRHGLIMLLICRATPVLPEVTACLSGLSRMPLSRFTMGWLINSLPYAALATYAGSVSTLENPMPAIYTAIGISGTLGMSWFLFMRRRGRV